MSEFKTTTYEMCHQYKAIGRLSAAIKCSDIFDEFDEHKKVELVNLLRELKSYLFDKIES